MLEWLNSAGECSTYVQVAALVCIVPLRRLVRGDHVGDHVASGQTMHSAALIS